MRINKFTSIAAAAALALGLSVAGASGASAAQPQPAFSCTGDSSGKIVWTTVNDTNAPITIVFQNRDVSKVVPVGWSVKYTTSFKWTPSTTGQQSATTHYLATSYNGVAQPVRTTTVTAAERAACAAK